MLLSETGKISHSVMLKIVRGICCVLME